MTNEVNKFRFRAIKGDGIVLCPLEETPRDLSQFQGIFGFVSSFYDDCDVIYIGWKLSVGVSARQFIEEWVEVYEEEDRGDRGALRYSSMAGSNGSLSPSNARLVCRLVIKWLVHEMRVGGRPRVNIVFRRRSFDTLSKAPFTSRNRAEVAFFDLFDRSMSCTKAMTASTADLILLPPIWDGCRRFSLSARYDSLVAKIFSITLPRQLRRATGR